MIRRISIAAALVALLIGGYLAYARYGPHPPVLELAPVADQIDRITIEKSARRMTLWRDGHALQSYTIALGFTPTGPKSIEGDGRTPEGSFTLNRRNPNSAYHLSLGLDYPHPADIARAAAQGLSAGGDIFIHGQPNGFGLITLPHDWTAGCIALSNAEIREVYHLAPIGTPVEITP